MINDFEVPCCVLTLQSAVAQINHIIGAEGIASLECQTVISNYGNLIWEYLVSGVCAT